MHSTVVEAPGADPLLDFDKCKSLRWRPGDDVPEWWGSEGASCAGAVASRIVDGEVLYVPVLCKRFSCSVCSWYRYGWLVRNIVQAMKDHGLNKFWTLTLATGSRTPDESFDDLQAAWKKLQSRITRKYGHITYVWVVETTKRGYAHMHLLVNKYIDHEWMSDAWLDVTGDSKVVYVERLEGKRAATYLAKYIGKEARSRVMRGSDVAGYHLFGRSANVEFDRFMPGSKGWQVVETCWQANARFLRRFCAVTEDRVVPSMRIKVREAPGDEWQATWRASGREVPPVAYEYARKEHLR